jgi:Cu-Zn family superoxide dismutase
MVTKLTALGVPIALLVLALVFVAVGGSPAAPPTEVDSAGAARGGGDRADAVARLKDTEGNPVGAVRFDARRGGRVGVEAEVSNVAPADEFHGFHVHTTGECDPATEVPFSSAGGHFNPDPTATHGEHAGDFPVLLVKPGGQAEAEFETKRFRLSQLFDGDGSAVIVHARRDNYANIPATTPSGAERYHSHAEGVLGPDSVTKATGDAGDRFACGVVRRPN